MSEEIVTQENIESRIFIIRGQKVMIDRDLAELYEVPTKYLNQQVRRNIERFPDSFMFQLSEREKIELVAICNRFKSLKHSTSFPYAFTEHGIAMLSSVLNSERAIKLSIFIINTFVRLRQLLYTNKEMANKLELIEGKVQFHDKAIREINKVIEEIAAPKPRKDKKIGFLK